VLLACAIALPQAIARSAQSEPRSAPAAAGAPGDATRVDLLAPEGSRSTHVAIAFAPDASSSTHRGMFQRVALKANRMLEMQAAARAKLPPLVVRRVIAAGDRIADAPYTYGGGHGNWDSGGYDCSGSVSYALHGGGLLDTALASGAFMSWGEPGPGRWITIYANGGHAFMVVAGRRFDTTGREATGSRWQAVMRDTSGYVVRHPAGL
jgi:cell wall-associated NlpC family hydrolase